MKSILCGLFVFTVGLTAFANSYIVLFKQAELNMGSLEHGQFQDLLQKTNEKSVEQLQQWLKSRRANAKIRDQLWLVRGAVITADDALVKKLAREPWIDAIYPDRVRKLISPSPDLKVANSLKELGETPQSLWGLTRIGLTRIREDFPTVNGSNVRVGVLDTGVQSKHPEIAGRIVAFKDFVNKIALPYDDHGHGTHVCGTIAGMAVGIAPQASLIVAKVFSAGGSGNDSELLAAMQWVFDPDGNPSTEDYAQIVSNSWGGDLPNAVNDVEDLKPYQLAIQTWIQGGIIPIFAAGNSGGAPNGFPGGLAEPIAVGAMTENDEVADFSSRGPNFWRVGPLVLSLLKPDISAPGAEITSAFPGNKFATWSGTSMATPHVSGALALALQVNPKIRLAEAKELLLESAERKIDFGFGYGVLNAHRLLTVASGKSKRN